MAGIVPLARPLLLETPYGCWKPLMSLIVELRLGTLSCGAKSLLIFMKLSNIIATFYKKKILISKQMFGNYT